MSNTKTYPLVHQIHVRSNGWHTAIVVERAAVVAAGLLPEAEDFPNAAFLEFGWGDREYYPAKEKTLGMTLGAALIPTPAIMHLAGLADAPGWGSADWQAVSLVLTDHGFRRMMHAIAGDFQRPDGGRANPVSPGLYPNSYFYHAHGEFHLFNTCNTWTARMLRVGDVAISPSGVITADELMKRLNAALDGRPAAGVGLLPEMIRPYTDAIEPRGLKALPNAFQIGNAGLTDLPLPITLL